MARPTKASHEAKIAAIRARTFSIAKGQPYVYLELSERAGAGTFILLIDPSARVRAAVRRHMAWLREELEAIARASTRPH